MLQDQSKAAYDAKVRVKQMEHQERLQDKRYAQERYRMKSEQKNNILIFVISLGMIAAIMVMFYIMDAEGDAGAEKQEQELQAIVDEIMIDIENGEFAEAYIKANSLYWDDSWTDDGEDKWNAIRKEIIRQIEEAEKNASGTSKYSDDEDGGWFSNWFK